MALPPREEIKIGASPNDGTGDDLRTAGGKSNRNFQALFDGYQSNQDGVQQATDAAAYSRSVANTTARTVQGYGDREDVPIASRPYGLMRYVNEAKRWFIWTQNGDTSQPNAPRDGWVGLYTQAEIKNMSIDATGTLPRARFEDGEQLVTGAARTVATYGERSGIDTSKLKYGTHVYVAQDGGRWFYWNKDEFGPGQDGWRGLQTETESKLIAVDAANIAFGKPQALRLDALEGQTINDFRVERVGGQYVARWDLTGTPVFQRFEWGQWVEELDAKARSITLPGLWDGSRVTVIGDSMSDGVKAAGTWALKAALRTGFNGRIEKALNREFDTTAAWNVRNAVIGGGVLTVTNGARFVWQTDVLEIGRAYTATIDVGSVSSAFNIRFTNGDVNEEKVIATFPATPGIKTVSFVATGSTIALEGDAGAFNGTINSFGVTADVLTTIALYSAGSKQVYRSGARPLRLTIANNRLPNGGQAVAVSAINGAPPGSDNPASVFYTYPADTGANSMTGMFAGRRVTLATTAMGGGNYTLTGAAGTTAVDVAAGTLFVPDFAANMATDELWIWMSQNHFYSGVKQDVNGTPQNINISIFAEIADMIRMARGARIIILGLLPDASWTPGTLQYAAVRAYNAELKRRWPQYYVVDAQGRDSLARILASGNGTANDNADVANGVTPRSLRITGDSLHLGDAGNEVIAQLVTEYRALQVPPPVVTDGTRFTLNTGVATAVAVAASTITLDDTREAVSADFLDITSRLNTSRKRRGVPVFDLDRARPLWPVGGDPASAWVDGVGSIIANPFNTYRDWDLALDFRAASYRSGSTITRDVTQLPGYSFTRAQERYELNDAGFLVPVASNVPAILPGKGFISRTGLTNLFANSNLQGGAAGTPGTAPTNVNSLPGTAGISISRTFGVDAVSGLTTMDVRIFGTNTQTSVGYPQPLGASGASTLSAVAGETMAFAVTWAILPGAILPANGADQPRVQIDEQNSGGGFLAGSGGSPPPSDGVMRRNSTTRVLTNANTAKVAAFIRVAVQPNETVDFTVRVMAPSLFKSTRVTASPFIITPTTGSRTIAADAMALTQPIPQDEDWLILAQYSPTTASGVIVERPLGVNVDTNNRMHLSRESNGIASLGVVAQGEVLGIGTQAASGQADPGRLSILGRHRAGKFTVVSRNAAGVIGISTESAAFPMPTGLTRIDIGNALTSLPVNSPIEFVGYRRGTYSDDQVAQFLRQLAG